MRSALTVLLCALIALTPASCALTEVLGEQSEAHEELAEADLGLDANARELERLQAENARLAAVIESAPDPAAVEDLVAERAALQEHLDQLAAEREELLRDRELAQQRAADLEAQVEGQSALVTSAAGAAGGPQGAAIAQGVVGLLGLGSVLLGRMRALAS